MLKIPCGRVTSSPLHNRFPGAFLLWRVAGEAISWSMGPKKIGRIFGDDDTLKKLASAVPIPKKK